MNLDNIENANLKIITENLFEVHTHVEAKIILKDVQKKVIEKNNNLKSILSNNYIELLNCSDLITKLASFSKAIHTSTKDQEQIFLENYSKINSEYQEITANKHGNGNKIREGNLQIEGINDKLLDMVEKTRKIAKKFQKKNLHCFATFILYDLLFLLSYKKKTSTVPKELKSRFIETYNIVSEMLLIDTNSTLNRLSLTISDPNLKEENLSDALTCLCVGLIYHLIKASSSRSFRFIEALYPENEAGREAVLDLNEPKTLLIEVMKIIFKRVFTEVSLKDSKKFGLPQLLHFLKTFQRLFTDNTVMASSFYPLIKFTIDCNASPINICQVIQARKSKQLGEILKGLKLSNCEEEVRQLIPELEQEWIVLYRLYYNTMVGLLRQELISANNEFSFAIARNLLKDEDASALDKEIAGEIKRIWMEFVQGRFKRFGENLNSTNIIDRINREYDHSLENQYREDEFKTYSEENYKKHLSNISKGFENQLNITLKETQAFLDHIKGGESFFDSKLVLNLFEKTIMDNLFIIAERIKSTSFTKKFNRRREKIGLCIVLLFQIGSLSRLSNEQSKHSAGGIQYTFYMDLLSEIVSQIQKELFLEINKYLAHLITKFFKCSLPINPSRAALTEPINKLFRLLDSLIEKYGSNSCPAVTERFKIDLNRQVLYFLCLMIDEKSKEFTIDFKNELASEIFKDWFYLFNMLELGDMDDADDVSQKIKSFNEENRQKLEPQANSSQFCANLKYSQIRWKTNPGESGAPFDDIITNLRIKASETNNNSIPIISEKHSVYLCYRQLLKSAQYKEQREIEAGGIGKTGLGERTAGLLDKKDMVGSTKASGAMKSIQQNLSNTLKGLAIKEKASTGLTNISSFFNKTTKK